MQAFVRIRLCTGESTKLTHGDQIGRLPSSELVIDDPRISEAHAMVSLRRGAIQLLALRRLLSVDGKPCSKVLLRQGLRVELADGISFVVEELQTPEQVIALSAPGFGIRALSPIVSLRKGNPPLLVARFDPDADAHLWSSGADWRLRLRGSPPKAIGLGGRFLVGDCEFEVCELPLEEAGSQTTLLEGGVDAPLRIVANFDSVELHRAGAPVLAIGGVGARILSELVAFEGPVRWNLIARELWPGEQKEPDLRRRWDVALSRLRSKLRDAGIRGDLISTFGTGMVQMIANQHDQLIDRN